MKVHWTNTAEEHLEAIFDYIVQNSPEYAKRMVDRITRRSQQIANYPLSGRSVPEYDFNQIREVIEGPYRIIYYIKADQIDILAGDSAPNRPSFPIQFGHPFRLKSATDSEANRPVIPI